MQIGGLFCLSFGAIVIASTAGKGIVPDDHPLSLSASTLRPEVHRFLPEADVILAVGTDLSETDSFVERMDLRGDIIRVDIDPSKTADFYPARLGIVADAAPAISAPRNEAEFRNAFANALAADRPTVIVVREGEEWLKQTRRMEWDRGVKDPPRATGPRP